MYWSTYLISKIRIKEFELWLFLKMHLFSRELKMKLIIFMVSSLVFLSSCATKKLYKSTSTNDYEESVSQYYISQEGKILILAEDNHYLLEADSRLLEIANSDVGSKSKLR